MSITGNANRIFRWSITLAAAGLAVAALSGCNHNPKTVGDNPRQVTVVGIGQVQGNPDTLTIELGIEFTAPDVTTAMNQSSDRQQAVVNAVEGAGVDRTEVSTTDVSLQPQYGASGTVTGYIAQNSTRVKVRKLDSAAHVLGVIVDTGGDATRINSVRYSIDDASQLANDARVRAFQDARNRAQQYAQLSGLKLGSVISISEAPGTTPPAPGPRAPMVSDVPVEPGQQTVSFSVTAVWQLS